MKTLLPAIFIVIGIFALVSSVGNFDFYFNNYKVARMVKLIGRNATRVVHAIIGILVIVLGILFLTGMLEMK